MEKNYCRNKNALIYLTYNSSRHIISNLPSLVSSAGQVFSIIAIDNCSQDDSVLLLQNMDIQPLVMDKNIGFTAAINIGLSLVPQSYEWIFIVNPDILPLSDNWMLRLTHGLPDECGIVGARLLCGDLVVHGGGQILQNPVLSIVRVPYEIANKTLWVNEAVGATKVTHRVGHPMHFTEPAIVPWVTFAVVGIRRKMLDDVGLLNEEYWLYSSDVAFCFEAWYHDWEVWYQPVAFSHETGGNMKTAPKEVHERGQHDTRLWLKREDEMIARLQSRINQS